MKKEDLIAMGLSEEQATAIVDKYGNMIPKERFDEVNNAKKALDETVKKHEADLEELRKQAKGNEQLQATITELQQANETAKTEYEQQLTNERMSAALKLSLNGKVHDVDLVAGLIDRNAIELDKDGNVTKGLDEQLKTLQESKSFLFVPEKAETTQFKGFTPAEARTGGGGGAEFSLGKLIAEERSKGTEQLDTAREKYFE
ncbi:phage scaffolding protein [Metasolibacillus sp.]|uniref:phage scaffolding protein n=1 Tax=Metasolibacillus sp. TaxID=2703680 RepID=UPI0025F6DB8A|nr:phage scaffolding protein [Metasolibacillus sp.]MCT6924085.1 phage scaffolding protein [Metasolibacillus sp.]MCT6940192.1 phage scaffolding protein [Metasolibacillus sp.]